MTLYNFFTASLLSSFSHFFGYIIIKNVTKKQTFLQTTSVILTIISGILIYFASKTIGYYTVSRQLVFLFFFFNLATVIQTDTHTLLISRFNTLFLIPFFWCAAFIQLLPINFTQSFMGSVLGFLLLYITALLAKKITKKESLGQGDSDLLALIGSVLGPIGCFNSLLLGSLIGSFLSLFLLLGYGKKARLIPLPFGTFLSYGAMILFLLQQSHTLVLPFLLYV